MQEGQKRIIKIVLYVCAIVTLCMVFALSTLGGLYYIASQEAQYTHSIYYVDNQYIGDIAGYDDCLIMQVNEVFYNDTTNMFTPSGEDMFIYFIYEDELYNSSYGDYIIVEWNGIDGQPYITGSLPVANTQ